MIDSCTTQLYGDVISSGGWLSSVQSRVRLTSSVVIMDKTIIDTRTDCIGTTTVYHHQHHQTTYTQTDTQTYRDTHTHHGW